MPDKFDVGQEKKRKRSLIKLAEFLASFSRVALLTR